MSNQFDLSGYELINGQYVKKKTVLQPREQSNYINKKGQEIKGSSYCVGLTNFLQRQEVEAKFRTIKLTLFGEPMPKQSAIQGLNKQGKKIFYPQKGRDERKKEYQKQIREQLPEGFEPFMNEVHVTKYHCIFSPLKSFHKIKGRMEAIRNGEIFYKNTQPDLVDNLKKLTFDSMAGLVLGNDGIIVTENDTAKYYGIGGCIIVTMKGY